MSEIHLPEAIEGSDPIVRAKRLLMLIDESKRGKIQQQFADAKLLLPKAALAITDLEIFIVGLQHGNAAELKRRERLVFELLSAMQPLFAKETSPFGRPSEAHQWLKGTAPRLREVFERASDFLGIEWIDMSSADDAAQAS